MNETLQRLQHELIELQTQLAFQEDLLQTLNGIVTVQHERLEKLEQSNDRLQKHLHDLLGWDDAQAEPQLPPHY